MTYQELLVEFSNRRIKDKVEPKFEIRDRLTTLEWAIQSILEKLRDTQEGPQ